MKPRQFVAAQFFILSFAYAMFFDPFGLSFALSGVVWIFNKKLAYLEIILIALLKGTFFFVVSISSGTLIWANAVQGSPLNPSVMSFLELLISYYVAIATLYGATVGVKLSGKLVNMQIRKHAPDLFVMIQEKK